MTTNKLILSPTTKDAVQRLLAHVLEMTDSRGPALGTEPTAVLSHSSSDVGQASANSGTAQTKSEKVTQ
jgi:hypothetical protein